MYLYLSTCDFLHSKQYISSAAHHLDVPQKNNETMQMRSWSLSVSLCLSTNNTIGSSNAMQCMALGDKVDTGSLVWHKKKILSTRGSSVQ